MSPCVSRWKKFLLTGALFGLNACSLDVQTTGEGIVTSDTQEIRCGLEEQQCSLSFSASNGSITLTPEPASGWHFQNWTGACADSSDTCTLKLSGTKKLQTIANFVAIQPGLSCGELSSGESETRLRYLEEFVSELGQCASEAQTRICDNGNFSQWSGSYQFETCAVEDDQHQNLPLLDSAALEYQGGFRLSANQFGDTNNSTLSYSPGVIAYNSAHHSLYVVGHEYEQGIAEFAIPEIVQSSDINEFAVGDNVLQPFARFHNTTRVNTGINEYFRITGMALIEGKLVVNYMNWYDASGNETDTSVVFQDAENLATTVITGPYQLQGAAHAAGWLTPIPDEWKTLLGGTYISGYSGGSIISRLSVGPSGFVVSPENELLSTQAPGAVLSSALLDFSLANLLYDKNVFGDMPVSASDILGNTSRENNLWTFVSGASYGFIVPGTNTYITLGYSGGHESGVGYKITQDSGRLCGGYCSYAAADNYNYFWFWRVSDLVKVKQGELLPHDVRPYQYGKLESPSKARISGGAFDAASGVVYVALTQGDTVPTYSRPPLFLVYRLNYVD